MGNFLNQLCLDLFCRSSARTKLGARDESLKLGRSAWIVGMNQDARFLSYLDIEWLRSLEKRVWWSGILSKNGCVRASASVIRELGS